MRAGTDTGSLGVQEKPFRDGSVDYIMRTGYR